MSSAMIRCPHCGHENPPGLAKCLGCGEPLEVEGGAKKAKPSQEVDVFGATHIDVAAPAAGIPKEMVKEPEGVRAAAFLILRSGEHEGRKYRLKQNQVIGRENADIIIRDPRMSRQHASVALLKGKYTITDLGSANHTFVNNTMIHRPTALTHGNKIRLGSTEFEFSTTDEE